MSYAEHLTATARALVDVARHGHDQLTATELAPAIAARNAVLDLLRTTYPDIAGVAPHAKVRMLGGMAAHPVAALSHALGAYPRPSAGVSPTDLFTADLRTPVALAWREAARHAIFAAHHWTAAESAPQLAPDVAWAGVADLAALTRQLVALDTELIDAATRLGRTDLADALEPATTSLASIAARETARVAAAGDVARAGPDRDANPVVRIVVARSAADLPATQRRLAELLDGASSVRVERLPHFVTALGRCALGVRDLLTAHGPDAALRAELLEHARLLKEATRKPGALASLAPGDLKPLHQAAQAVQALRRHGPGLAADRRLLVAYVHELAASTASLTGVVERAIASGAWLVPDTSASMTKPGWVRLKGDHPEPYAVRAVRAAAEHGQALRDAVNSDLGSVAPAVQHRSEIRAVAVLNGSVANAMPIRPVRPANPLRPIPKHRIR